LFSESTSQMCQINRQVKLGYWEIQHLCLLFGQFTHQVVTLVANFQLQNNHWLKLLNCSVIEDITKQQWVTSCRVTLCN
jgi:hypothetical protein